MSTFTEFDYNELFIERRESISGVVGEAIVGLAKVGQASATDWEEVEMASISISSDYTPTPVEGTDVTVLLIGTQQATLNTSYYDDTSEAPVRIFDTIRIRYKSSTVGGPWIVDTIRKRRVMDPDGDASLNGYIRVDLSCNLLGPYASAMNKTVCLGAVPAEKPLRRLLRYGVGVSFPEGWDFGW